MDKEIKAHFFFAVRLPEETKIALKDRCDTLKEDLHFKKWVHHEDFHITLAFLGTAPSEKLHTAKMLAEAALEGQKAFPLQINQLGVFGREESPRIFLADIQREDRLSDVRDKVFTACMESGFSLETRPFKPHITLARKWSGSSLFQHSLLKHNNPFLESPLSFTASEVVLYQTHLDKTPKYESIAIFPLLDE